jgi:hypothetical protein
MSKFYLLIDTETACPMGSSLVYDFAAVVLDEQGTIKKEYNAIINEVWNSPFLFTAYYKEKLVNYIAPISNGTMKIKTLETVKNEVKDIIDDFSIDTVTAYNLPFDLRALTTTSRYLTTGKQDKFFRHSIQTLDLLKMARQRYAADSEYSAFCEENNQLTKTGKPCMSAEVVHQYISKTDYIEEHMALSDCRIEAIIFSELMKE